MEKVYDIDLLTHAQRHITAPGSSAHTGKGCREGQLIAAQAAVANAGAPLEDGALNLTVGDLGWRRARHSCRQKKREISAQALRKSRNASSMLHLQSSGACRVYIYIA